MAIDVSRLVRKALASSHRFDGAFLLELREAARASPVELVKELQRLLPGDDETPSRAYPTWLLARHIEHTLSTTPGIDQASAAFRLALEPPRPRLIRSFPFTFDESARERWILARLAVRQPPDVVIELLERFEEPAIDEQLFHAYPGLPPLDEPDAALAGWLWGSQTLYELEPPMRGVDWPRAGSQIELRAFRLPPASENGSTASVLACLPLQSIAEPPVALRVRSQTAAEAFALLFHVAALDEGWASGFAAWPRLVAWRLVAALSGKKPEDSPHEIQKAALELEWTRVAVRGGWFGQIDLGWAFCIAARDRATRHIRVLVAARVEPRT